MRLLAIDPGSEESALLIYDTDTGLPTWWEKASNYHARAIIDEAECREMHVEMIASYGMPVGVEVFETCVWIGRFTERWNQSADEERYWAQRVYRHEVKFHLCKSARAKDSNVRQALIDRYGGKEKAIGRKATPGPLYGLSGDCWAALGVAVTVADRYGERVAA